MAVMIEAISVVIRTSTLKAKYPGGVWEYMSNVPNGSLCIDKYLTRVGFMVPSDVATYIQGLEETAGLTFIVNDAAQDIVVVDQNEGFTTYCDWAVTEFVDYQGVKLRVCRDIDDHGDEIGFPYDWSLENSLYTTELFLRDEEAQNRLVYLRNQGASEVYFDKVTGKEVYIGRTKSDWGFDRES